MLIKKYQVDAFADHIFEGNPAVVCPVDEFPEDHVMQMIAAEHNLSETAFIVKANGYYKIRWFTPLAEVALCGHATLASAFVIFNFFDHPSNLIQFETLYSGKISVEKEDDKLILDFPSEEVVSSKLPVSELQACFDSKIIEHADGSTDCIILLENEEAIMKTSVNFQQLARFDRRGFIITAPSKKYDFVSRFFAPRVGINEDPVTGSAHSLLIPYWAQKLNKTNLVARQMSTRGGTLYCTYAGDRVKIAGKAVLYSEGIIHL